MGANDEPAPGASDQPPRVDGRRGPGPPLPAQAPAPAPPRRVEVRRGFVAVLNAARFLRLLPSQPRAGEPARSGLLALFGAVAPPLDMQILGRTLLHTMLVGVAAGLVGAAFFAGLEHTQRLFLDSWAGFAPLRAHGERIVGEHVSNGFRPWIVVLLPA